MKNNFKIILILVFASTFSSSFSQDFLNKLKKITWTFGLSDHIVVDGGKELSFPFKTKAWNYVPYPSRVTVEGYFKNGWSFQTELAYTQYKTGNIVDNVAITKPAIYFGADFNAKFAFASLVKKQGWFDPYVTVGYGLTHRNKAINSFTGNNNIGLGCNFWIYKGFGVNLQGLGKFVLKGGDKSNYTHYSFAIVYKLVSKRDIMRSGK